MRALAPLATFALPCLFLTLTSCGGTGTGPSGDGDGDGDGDVGGTCTAGDLEVKTPAAAAVTKTGGVPDTSCLGNPTVLPAGVSARVEGCVDIFGLGDTAVPGLKVAVFSRDQDPGSDVPAYGETEVGVAAQAGPLQDLARDCDSEGYYRIDGIPTHEPLIVKVWDTNAGAQQRAITTYSYDVILLTDNIITNDDGDDILPYEANLVYRSTYDSIPTYVGKRVDGQSDISDGVGRGVVAGEIHDCADVIVRNAVVGFDGEDSGSLTAYFNGNEDDPLPDPVQSATNTDGLYVLVNVNTDPGANEHTITPAILDPACEGEDCQCLALGSSTVRAFPDSVTILTLAGELPVTQ